MRYCNCCHLSQGIDYLNLPEGYVPDGMEIMATARPHRSGKSGRTLDERTKEDRRKDRLAAQEKVRSARRAKADVSYLRELALEFW